MALTIVIILTLLGLALIMLEILLIPGTTLVGLLGGAMMLAGVYYAYQDLGTTFGNYYLLGSTLVTGASVFYAFKSHAWKKFVHQHKLKGRANVIDPEEVKVDDEGITVSELKPSGIAMINDKRFEVRSKG